MIEYKTGNLFETEADAIVNTVNCVGVMGKGIALQFKERFPENYKAYEKACKLEQIEPGKMFVFKESPIVAPFYIINFPTKRHWRGKSRIQDIQAGLKDLVRIIRDLNIKSIALPPLGCGLGGLNWNEVKPLIEIELQSLTEVKIEVFEPKGAPANAYAKIAVTSPKMTPAIACFIVLMQNYIDALLDPFITLLELHKLMYFMQTFGEPLKLRYKKAHYGPYAENLRHVLNNIEDHYITGNKEDGENPDKPIKLLPGAAKEASDILSNQFKTLQRIQNVENLVDGFESSFGLELLATVHFVANNEHVTSIQGVIKKVYQWNEHKRQFSERQIELAVKHLINHGLISPSTVGLACK